MRVDHAVLPLKQPGASTERIHTTAKLSAPRREQVAQIFSGNPALLRLRELDAKRAGARGDGAYLHRFPEAGRP